MEQKEAWQPLLTMSGKGRELCDMLRDALGVPKRAQSFSVHFGVNDVVRVECEYIPEARDA
jgi:hypothetical protein